MPFEGEVGQCKVPEEETASNVLLDVFEIKKLFLFMTSLKYDFLALWIVWFMDEWQHSSGSQHLTLGKSWWCPGLWVKT